MTSIEGAALGVLVNQPMHGFELAKSFEAGSWLGEVFTAQRPVVYRALKTLDSKSLLVTGPKETTGRGPARTPVEVNAAGRQAFHRWVSTPVEHMRDVRVELLVKLALHEHLGLDIQPFIAAQIEHFTPIYEALNASPVPSEGIDRYSALWRQQASHTTMRFLDMLRAGSP